MNLSEAVSARHSVRQYSEKPIPEEIIETLREEIDGVNRESGLHIQLVIDEPKAFDSTMARYGKISGVRNYLAVIGKKGKELDELCGYYGEKLVLKAQMLGLNSCWVGLTYKKIPSAFSLAKGEKLIAVIALGYGLNEGKPHKGKNFDDVVDVGEEIPEWFRRGVESALLAPTAVNQQKFCFVLKGDRVEAKAGRGFYSKVDLGIVKYHFEIGANKGREIWL